MEDMYNLYWQNQQAAMQEQQRRREEERQKKIFRKERFNRFGRAGILYTLFYTFCLYHNTSGITYPFFVAGTLYFYYYCMKKSGITAKQGSAFYIAATVLLGVSNVLTDNRVMISFNRIGIGLLFLSFLLHQYYEDVKWSFESCLLALCKSVWGVVSQLFAPYADFNSYLELREKKPIGRMKYVAMGLLIGFPMVLILLCLLSSADTIFYSLFVDDFWRILIKIWMWGDVDVGLVLWKIFLGLGIGYSLFAFLEQRKLQMKEKKEGAAEPLIGITFLSMTTAVYLLFCGVQILGLFGSFLSLPEGYSYSDYATEGFYQLLFVSILNLALVQFCVRFFRENKALKLLLTLISACTYIMIASSTYRIFLYIHFFQFTFQRILALWALFVIAVLMIGVVLRIYRKDFPLFRYGVAVVTVCYLCLSFAKPDYWIARMNLSLRVEHTVGQDLRIGGDRIEWDLSYIDWDYLSTLSADAAPVIYVWETDGLTDNTAFAELSSQYPEDFKGSWYVYWRHLSRQSKKMSFRTWNLSRYIGGERAGRRFVWHTAEKGEEIGKDNISWESL